MEWYLKVMRENYANFKGRARRTEYWMFSLFFFLFAILGGFVIGVLYGIGGEVPGAIAVFLFVIWYLAHLVPSLAVTVRRLHDTGKSGWFLLINLIPYIGGLIVFVFTVIEGDNGDNEYGPDPKAIASSSEKLGM